MANSPEPSDPFDAFDSIGEVIAFVHHRFGSDGVRQCLQGVDGLERETLEKAAVELKGVGLRKVAILVQQEAEKRPRATDHCPYESNSTDARAWHQAQARRAAWRK